MSEPVEGPRARYRKQVRDEVQARAWEQISEDGVSALSLKAIATQMGMTAPALYRYYSSRDELLTELILSAYRDLAEFVEAAVDESHSPTIRLTEIARVIRRWAVAQPQRYLLLYGTPVPGYHAPDSATDLARRIFAPVLAGFSQSQSDSSSHAAPSSPDHRSLSFWTRLHGVLSLELAGHFVGMDIDVEQLYDSEVRSVVEGIGAVAR